MEHEFPFGIDPTRFVPEPEKPLTIEVEGVGSRNFNHGNDSVVGMAATVVAEERGHSIIKDNTRTYLAVTGWRPDERKLTVKLNE